MSNFNNAVYGSRGTNRIVVGFRCDECGKIAHAMWGTTCNECREKERRHKELIAALRTKSEQGLRKEKQMKVYVAGPMTGYQDLNYPAFALASDRLRQRGFHAVSPAELNAITEDYRVAMRKDISALIDCEAILRLNGWEKSIGATLENRIAEVLGIPVLVDCGVCEYHHLDGNCGGDREAC